MRWDESCLYSWLWTSLLLNYAVVSSFEICHSQFSASYFQFQVVLRFQRRVFFLDFFEIFQNAFSSTLAGDRLWRKEKKTILEWEQRQRVQPIAAFSKINFVINNCNKLLESFLVIGCFAIFIYLAKRRTAISFLNSFLKIMQ